MNLIDGQLEIKMSPVSFQTDAQKRSRNHEANGAEYGSSQACFSLPTGDVLGPDGCAILHSRWNTLSDEQKEQTFPPIAPNYIVELRSRSDSPQQVHRKMKRWMEGGVDEGGIDRSL
ncbi:3482_t:CDS:2 [Paraglomus occultum]|uniref:3482_t:CDS:1 n=1 Tax=Paraglomus occultum TaxID=144539 RepID=A0A9N8WN20_9GLOM|nr:3482_t:CDS:2 [Paraglomus occultum]